MAGLLNASMGDGEPDSPILTQIQQGIEEKVPQDQRESYMALTVAGMKVMFSESTGQRVMQKLKTSEDIIADVSQGVSNILVTIFNEIAGNMPPQKQGELMANTVPASIMLMCQALDAWEKITDQTVTDDMAAECTNATVKAILAKFNITPDQVKQAVAQGRSQQQGQAAQQPTAQPPAGV